MLVKSIVVAVLSWSALALSGAVPQETPEPAQTPDRKLQPEEDRGPSETAVDEPAAAPPTAPAPTVAAMPVGPRVPASEVIARFLDAIRDNSSYEASAREFVASSRQKLAAGDDPADFINQALAVLSPAFKTGLDHLAADDVAKAADAFEALAGSKDPYLAVASAGLAATCLVELDDLDRCAALLDRLFAAHPNIDAYTPAPHHLAFLRAFCQVHDLQYDQARASMQQFLSRYPDAPERLRVGASQILTELSNREPGRLGDVCDLLGYARRRISHGDTGERVILRQTEAVKLLEALIEEAEEQERNQQQGDGSGQGRGGSGAPQGNQQPGGPANRSSAPEGADRIGELRKQRARPGEAWGKMPPKEREQILQTLQKQFPSQYRELLEQYYKQLAKDAKAP